MISLCTRIPRQTADWLHDVSKYFLLRGFYRKDIISTYSCRVGGGYFLQPLSRGWCKWESIVRGLIQNWIFKLIQLFFILFFFLLLMCPCASSPVTRRVSLEFASPRRRQALYSSEKSLCLNQSNWYDRSTWKWINKLKLVFLLVILGC